MINQKLNDNLKALKTLFYETENFDYAKILQPLINRDIDEGYLQELSSLFGFGKKFSPYHVLFTNQLTNEILNIDGYVNNINQQIYLEKTQVEENKEFVFNEKNNTYNITFYNIKFSSPSNGDDFKQYAIKLAKNYQRMGEFAKSQTQQVVVSCLLKDENFIDTFGNVDRSELIKKLNLPSIKLLSNNDGVIEYADHTLDNEHIISIEFTALYSNLTDVTIDG